MARIFFVTNDAGDPAPTAALLTERGHEIIAIVPIAKAPETGNVTQADLILVDVPSREEERAGQVATHLQSTLNAPVVFMCAPESLSLIALDEPFYVTRPVNGRVLAAIVDKAICFHRRQRDLRERHARLKHALDDLEEAQAISDIGSCDQNLLTGEFHVSETCLRLHGLPVDASLSSIMDLLTHVPDEDRRRTMAVLEEARINGREYETEYEVKPPGAERRTIHQRMVLRRDPAGRPSHIFVTAQDITRRKRSEEALRESQERATQLLRERDFILEHTRDILYYIDSNARVYYISPAVEGITGFTPDEWKGPFAAHLADTPTNRRVMQETAETLVSGREWPPSDVDILHKDGRMLTAEVSERPIISGGKVIGIVGVARDITDRRQAEYRLRQAAAVFENTHEAIIITDAARHINAVNRAFAEITGYSETEVRGKEADFLSTDTEELHFRENVWAMVADSGRWTGEMWNRRKSGELFPAWMAISTIRDDRGSITNYVVLFSDLSRIRESEDKLEQLAHYDPLTHLPNRLLFHSRLAHALRSAERQRSEIAVLFIDLDHFKNINDTLGHPAGDRLLQEVAKRLSGTLRKEDTISHLGGDEFVIIRENVKDPRYLVDVAQKLLASLRRPYQIDGHEAEIGASMGIAVYPRDGLDVTRLIQNADAAMYRAKEMGRARFQFYTTELTRNAVERMTLATALRSAIQRNEFELYYQPQISLTTGAVVGAEALLRWRHPKRGLLLPGAFIPLSEEIGLIGALGRWVVRRAFAQAREWADAGAKPFTMAVNLSVFQLAPEDGFVEQVAEALRETAVDPRNIEFEITESAIMRNAEEAVGVVKELHDLGMHIAIDDFGTGYSSMSYLKYFAVDRLKVDASFIQDIPHDASDQAIADAIIALGHSLKMKVIAEGVETVEQKAFLLDHGCDEMQGFLFSPPVTGPEFKAILLR